MSALTSTINQMPWDIREGQADTRRWGQEFRHGSSEDKGAWTQTGKVSRIWTSGDRGERKTFMVKEGKLWDLAGESQGARASPGVPCDLLWWHGGHMNRGDSLAMMIHDQSKESHVAEVETAECRNVSQGPELKWWKLGCLHSSFIAPLRFHTWVFTFVLYSLHWHVSPLQMERGVFSSLFLPWAY